MRAGSCVGGARPGWPARPGAWLVSGVAARAGGGWSALYAAARVVPGLLRWGLGGPRGMGGLAVTGLCLVYLSLFARACVSFGTEWLVFLS